MREHMPVVAGCQSRSRLGANDAFNALLACHPGIEHILISLGNEGLAQGGDDADWIFATQWSAFVDHAAERIPALYLSVSTRSSILGCGRDPQLPSRGSRSGGESCPNHWQVGVVRIAADEL